METTRPTTSRFALPWFGWALALALAIGCGVLLAQLLMSPPSGELWELGGYFSVAGGATMAAGWGLLQIAERTLRFSIQAKTFLGNAIATALGLLNVLIIAQLMFISTDHDLRVLLATLVYSGIVTAFFSLWLARVASARLVIVTAAVRSLASGNLAASAEVSGGDEIAALARDVNALAERLREAETQRQTLDAQRRELTIAVSHDLRTPLASLRAMVEALDDEVVVGSEVKRYHQTMRREIERLSLLIDDLFELAQIDSGALRLERKPVSVAEIAVEVADSLQATARLSGIHLSCDLSGSCQAPVDGLRVARAVTNLVRNAIEHTPESGTISVRVEEEDGWVAVRIEDSGEGIDPADIPHIWERFYRAERSRRRSNRNDSGAGLGLAIVKGIAEAHGGSIDAESTPGKGTLFTLRLPST